MGQESILNKSRLESGDKLMARARTLGNVHLLPEGGGGSKSLRKSLRVRRSGTKKFATCYRGLNENLPL